MKTLMMILTLCVATLIAMAQCEPVMVVHSSIDGISAISQTITYQVVTGVKGEESKCWITSNLGATRQALAVNDNSTDAAGWYWQFNRLQGYYHDGTNRTPNSNWTWVDENSDWTYENDPCKILGPGWRVPTFLEWAHTDYSFWNWTQAYASPLKLHAAGMLYAGSGQLQNRGVKGVYWSSTQAIYSAYGRTLWFWSANSNTTMTSKSFGQSIRCLK